MKSSFLFLKNNRNASVVNKLKRICAVFKLGNERYRLDNWSGDMEISGISFTLTGEKVGATNIRLTATHSYSSNMIVVPLTGNVNAADLLPLIMEKYNTKLSSSNIQ